MALYFRRLITYFRSNLIRFNRIACSFRGFGILPLLLIQINTMRNLLYILFFLNAWVFAQEETYLVASIRASTSSVFNKDHSGIGASFGAQFEIEEGGELNTSILYRFSTDDISDVSYSGINANFLGGSLKYLFRKRENIIRPYFGMNLLFKIGPNFSGKYRSSNGFVVLDEKIGEDFFGTYIYTNKFSTPFTGALMLGCDFKVVKNLHLNLGLGYGIETSKTKTRKEYEGYTIYDDKNPNTSEIEKQAHQMLEIRFGVSYYILKF